jgi:hypothetical protein
MTGIAWPSFVELAKHFTESLKVLRAMLEVPTTPGTVIKLRDED